MNDADPNVSGRVPRTPVYVMPAPDDREEVDVVRLASGIWDHRWWIAAVTSACLAAAIIYSLAVTPWYRGTVVASMANERSTGGGIGNQLGQFASLAGISVGGGGERSVAVLDSRELARRFIEEQNLLPVFYPDRWDDETGDWRPDAAVPNPVDAARFFDGELRTVEVAPDTGMVTVEVEWTDPELAARWANGLVQIANSQMRQEEISEAERNVVYLREELTGTVNPTLQQSIVNLLEGELQKLMLARGNLEFAFNVVDPAYPVRSPVYPNMLLLSLIATFLGGSLSMALVLLRLAILARNEEVAR